MTERKILSGRMKGALVGALVLGAILAVLVVHDAVVAVRTHARGAEVKYLFSLMELPDLVAGGGRCKVTPGYMASP